MRFVLQVKPLIFQVKPLASALGMAVLLSGCASYESGTSWLNRNTSGVFEGAANAVSGIAPWGGTRPASPGDSQTVQRVLGAEASIPPLLPEPGNVWPEPEAPRATLMNPDQALRGIGGYAPNVPDREAPPSITPDLGPQREPPERTRRGAGGPFVPAPTAAMPTPPGPQAPLPPLAPLPRAPDRAAGGQVIMTPQGGISPSTSSNTSPFSSPTGGGTITRDGNTSIINRPGEPPQIIQNPR